MKTNSNYIGLMNNGIHDSNGFSAIYPCPNGHLPVFFSCFIPNLLTFFDWFGIILWLVFLFRFNTVSLSFYRYKQYWRRESSLIQFSKWNLMIYMIRHVNIVWMLAVYWSYNGFVICTMRYDCEQQPWALTDVRKTDNFQFENTMATNIYTHRNMLWLCANERYYDSNRNTYTNSIAHTTQNIALSTHNQPYSNCSRTTTTDFPSFTCYTHVHRASVNGEQFILVYGIYPSWTSTNCSEARLNYTQKDRELYQLSFRFH